ncbi:sodium:proline symporter [Thiobacillus denitrificans]|nr:sodium:proline symporter [Thiobacillus denitrificans]
MTAETVPPRTAHERIDPVMALVAGLGAGVVATLAQIALWWLAGMPLPETLFRDARLTAALVMGIDVLPPPSTPQWNILLVATLIHFLLSVVYALIAAPLASRLRNGSALFAGALYGLAIYVVNLYGLTLLFPWFAGVRDWVTLITHLVFGVALAGGYRLFARGPQRPGRHSV